MTPFWPNQSFSRLKSERGSFQRGVQNDPKMTLFKKCQKVSKMTVFGSFWTPSDHGKGVPKWGHFGPHFGTPISQFKGDKHPKMTQNGSKKGSQK